MELLFNIFMWLFIAFSLTCGIYGMVGVMKRKVDWAEFGGDLLSRLLYALNL
jgi:hypothetical protein